ncbi:hypothetical protein B296_00014280 [Ensete ventricosum]|uniref:Uncharacterized protein n=1 Tax=Ensete ventricosum TaxID=4639 RepID=A0A426YWD8_ENSVE|nr:hypothetical protein B296_00014280 [Ensete ventricosum]
MHDSGEDLLDRPRYPTRSKDTRLAKIHNSGKRQKTGRDIQLGQRMLDWPRYTTRAKDTRLVEIYNSGKGCWTGRDIQLKYTTQAKDAGPRYTTRAKDAGLVKIHNSSKGHWIGRMWLVCGQHTMRMVNTHARWGGHVTSGSLALLSCPLSRRVDVVVLQRASSNAIHFLRLGRRNAGPSCSSGGQSGPPSSSSGVMTRANMKALQALEGKKLCHDFNSTEIPPEEATQKVPKASSKRSVESPSGQRKKAKVLGRYKSHREGIEIPGSFRQEASCPGRGDTDSHGEAEQDGEALIKYVREMQSEVLMDQATKTMVLREGGEYEGEAKLQPINHESLLLFIESHQKP